MQNKIEYVKKKKKKVKTIGFQVMKIRFLQPITKQKCPDSISLTRGWQHKIK